MAMSQSSAVTKMKLSSSKERPAEMASRRRRECSGTMTADMEDSLGTLVTNMPYPRLPVKRLRATLQRFIIVSPRRSHARLRHPGMGPGACLLFREPPGSSPRSAPLFVPRTQDAKQFCTLSNLLSNLPFSCVSLHCSGTARPALSGAALLISGKKRGSHV